MWNEQKQYLIHPGADANLRAASDLLLAICSSPLFSIACHGNVPNSLTTRISQTSFPVTCKTQRTKDVAQHDSAFSTEPTQITLQPMAFERRGAWKESCTACLHPSLQRIGYNHDPAVRHGLGRCKDVSTRALTETSLLTRAWPVKP